MTHNSHSNTNIAGVIICQPKQSRILISLALLVPFLTTSMWYTVTAQDNPFDNYEIINLTIDDDLPNNELYDLV